MEQTKNHVTPWYHGLKVSEKVVHGFWYKEANRKGSRRLLDKAYRYKAQWPKQLDR
jgi:hypothetical protein